MNALTLLLIAAGALALLAMLLGVVALARTLDGATDTAKTDAPEPPPKPHGGSLSATLATLAAHAGAQSANQDKPEKSSSAKQVITGMAIAAGVLMLIVGIIAGDG